jgi:hypothetical protein
MKAQRPQRVWGQIGWDVWSVFGFNNTGKLEAYKNINYAPYPVSPAGGGKGVDVSGTQNN